MNEADLYSVLLGAHISEKTTNIADASNQVSFKVARSASRPQIKAAIEKIYSVNVLSVRVVNVKGKVKRNVRGTSRRPDWKKAYVRLQAGQDIDFGA